jgi:hypothetical protein
VTKAELGPYECGALTTPPIFSSYISIMKACDTSQSSRTPTGGSGGSHRCAPGVQRFSFRFPDWREDVVDLVAEGDKVVGHFKCTGTLRGECMGMPPTGKRMEVDEVYFLRVKEGRIVEYWGLEDNFTRLRQLGLM